MAPLLFKPILHTLLWGFMLSAPTLFAQTSSDAQLQAALNAAGIVAQKGPAEITLIDQAKLNLPEGFVFIPSAQAQMVLRAMGNTPGNNVLGMIFPTNANDSNWFIVAQYDPVGYIKDDDAKDWNVDDLLKNIKEGTEFANQERRSRGIPKIEVVGWVEKPTYDSATHRLVWSLSSRDKGALANAEKGVNYNTYALGREGFISLNLVTDLRTAAAEKPIAKHMLAALNFNEGKRYTDFNSFTDQVAEYGLAALVAGVAAKKLGLFAIAAAFFAKFAEILLLGGVALIGLIGKLWRDKKNAAPAPIKTSDTL